MKFFSHLHFQLLRDIMTLIFMQLFQYFLLFYLEISGKLHLNFYLYLINFQNLDFFLFNSIEE